MIDSWLSGVAPHWLWLSAGLVLGVAEMIAPGFFLIWLGLAAIATGLVVLLLPIGPFLQVGLFAILAIASVYAARRWMKANPIETTDPLLNDRGGRLAGEIVTVVEAIDAGQGRVKVGDSVWSAKGPDAPVGARVRVTGAQGATLTVEAA